MFVSRGYRGMHIFPYPNHIKEQINQGLIAPGGTEKVLSQLDDQCNYDESIDINISSRNNESKQKN